VLRKTSGTFRDRADAGRRLGARLRDRGLAGEPVVLGLPRGGVVVAAEVATALGGQLDVLVARKLARPEQPELALGALAEGGSPVWDDTMLRRMGLTSDDLAGVVTTERRELVRQVAAYRGARPAPEVGDRVVVLVDDGVATGATARAALRALRATGSHGPARLLLAVPVAAPESLATFTDADEVITLLSPAPFVAVGRWYDDFAQLSDDDVRHALDRPERRR
jgi:putative phosphoribosyl transferase